MTNKIARYGKVAVFYSTGFGLGWSTANDDPWYVFGDAKLLELVVTKDYDGVYDYAKQLFPKGWHSGFDTLKVGWVDEGSLFYIYEYDGHETLVPQHELLKA